MPTRSRQQPRATAGGATLQRRRQRVAAMLLAVSVSASACGPIGDRSGGDIDSAAVKTESSGSSDSDDSDSSDSSGGSGSSDTESTEGAASGISSTGDDPSQLAVVSKTEAALAPPKNDPGELAPLVELAQELLEAESALPIEERVLPGRWTELWDALQILEVDSQAIPLDVAPVWLLAAANTSQLTGCAQRWVDFHDALSTRLDESGTAQLDTAEFFDDASAAFFNWLVDYTLHESTVEIALGPCGDE